MPLDLSKEKDPKMMGLLLAGLGSFLLFAAADGVGGAFLVAGSHESHPWLAELAVSPDALIGIPILWWCYRRWRDAGEESESLSGSPACVTRA
jgi:hypothetical protein